MEVTDALSAAAEGLVVNQSGDLPKYLHWEARTLTNLERAAKSANADMDFMTLLCPPKIIHYRDQLLKYSETQKYYELRFRTLTG